MITTDFGQSNPQSGKTPPPIPSSARINQEPLSGPKIFVLEDERLVAENLKILLQESGFPVVGLAASGEDTIQKVRKLNPDLLFMDIRVQGKLDGIETAIQIQAERKDPIPVVFLTAYSEDRFPHLGQLPATSYVFLRKPYIKEDLSLAIEEVMAKMNRS